MGSPNRMQIYGPFTPVILLEDIVGRAGTCGGGPVLRDVPQYKALLPLGWGHLEGLSDSQSSLFGPSFKDEGRSQ